MPPGRDDDLELEALEGRHVRVFWPDCPPRPAARLTRFMRFLMERAEPPGEWRTPYERGEPGETITEYENGRLEESVAYMRRLRLSLKTWRRSGR